MTSEFDAFVAGAFDDALDTIGRDSFTIAGLGGTFYGILDKSRRGEVLHDEGGGMIAQYDATIVAAISQFVARPKNTAEVTCGGIVYKIDDVETDTVSYTLKLIQNVD